MKFFFGKSKDSNLSTSAGALPTRISFAVDSGFTLMETLVAITLLLLAIGGPMYAVSQSLSSAIYARDQITASYLAQDAVEYIRNVRDHNALDNNSWLAPFDTTDYLPTDGTPGASFNIDTHSGKSYRCSNVDAATGKVFCDPMNYDSSPFNPSSPTNTSGIYSYGTSVGDFVVVSPFTRTLTLQKVDKTQTPTHEVRLTVDISWHSNIAGAKQDFTVTELLTNWEK